MVKTKKTPIIIVYHSEKSGATKSILTLKHLGEEYFHFIKIPLDLYGSIKAIISNLKNFMESNVILFNGLHTFSNPVIMSFYYIFRLKRKNIFLYWHESGWHWRGIIPAKHGLRGFALNMLIERLIKNSINMTVSQYCIKWLKKRFNLNQVELLYNTIDYDYIIKSAQAGGYNYKENTYKLVMSIAPPTERKGFKYFLQVAEQSPNLFRFVWIGKKGNIEKPLNEKIKSINDGANYKKVIILDFDKNPYRLLKYADLFFLPSLDEPFGLVYLESFALGKFVIAPKTCGFSEIIDETNGLAFIYEEFSEVLEMLESDDLEYYLENFQEKRTQKAKKYDNKQFYREFLEILKEKLNQNNSS